MKMPEPIIDPTTRALVIQIPSVWSRAIVMRGVRILLLLS